MDWDSFDRGVFLLNVLGIVYNPKTKKILIGRRESDPILPGLSWCFPGGRPGYGQELEEYLMLEIKKKTSLTVSVKQVFFAKTYPEKRELLSIYYLCTSDVDDAKAGEKFVETKWVSPTEIKQYFTTSLHDSLMEYLIRLEAK